MGKHCQTKCVYWNPKAKWPWSSLRNWWVSNELNSSCLFPPPPPPIFLHLLPILPFLQNSSKIQTFFWYLNMYVSTQKLAQIFIFMSTTGCTEIDCLSGTVLYFSATKHQTRDLFTNVLFFHSQTHPDPIWHATYQSIQSIWWNSRPCLFHILNQALSISCSWHFVKLLLDDGLQVLDRI